MARRGQIEVKRYRVVVTITEGDDSRPLVIHELYGDTPDEALSILQAHRKADKFLRQCMDSGCYDHAVDCRSEAYLEDLVTGKVKAF